MKQKLIDGVLYVYSFEPYIITEDTDAKVIYVQEELFNQYKVLNPTLSQLAKKNFNIITAYTPEWNIYRYMPDESPSIVLNTAVLSFENTSMEGNTITLDDSVGTFNLFESAYGVTTQYSSSYTNVATINEDGDVTISSYGTTVITAYSSGDETHDPYNEDYTLIINEGIPGRLNSGIGFSSYTVTAFYGEENLYPTLVNPNSLTVSYSTTNKDYVSVNELTGEITLLMNPTDIQEVNIYATFSGNENYLPTQIRYTINLYPRRSTANLSWSQDTFTATIGETNLFPYIVNPDNLELSYYSSDTTKATVNILNGNITLIAATTEPIEISAIFSGNTQYKPITAKYTLTIVEVPKQETLDVEYQSTNGIIQLYGPHVEPTPVLQETLDVEYYSENGIVQLYGEEVQPLQETLDVEYSSQNGITQLYGPQIELSQVEIE